MSTITREAQEALKHLGLYTGEVDGLYGPKSREALVKFQIMHGLPATGEMSDETYRELLPQPIKGRSEWPLEKDARAFYGEPGTRQVKVAVPWTLRLAWEPQTTIKAISCHELVAGSLERVLGNVRREYTDAQLESIGANLYGGCLNVRPMRGGTRMSMHSWGIAIDWDPARNRLKMDHTQARLAQGDCWDWWDCWEAEGWVSLGRERDYDWMHVQAARLS